MCTHKQRRLMAAMSLAGLLAITSARAAEPARTMVVPAAHQMIILPDEGVVEYEDGTLLPATGFHKRRAAPRGVLPHFSTDYVIPSCPSCAASGDCGAGPCPAYFPPRPRGCKDQKRRMMLENRLGEPDWYRYYRGQHYGYYPTQWSVWPAGWDMCRHPAPGGATAQVPASRRGASAKIEQAPGNVPLGSLLKPVPGSAPQPPPRNSRAK